MATTLEKRIEALEQANPTDKEPPMFIRFVGMDAEPEPIERITHGGKTWERHPDESEQDLKNRALLETAPPKPGCRTVFLCN